MQISMDFSAQCNAQTKQVTPIEGMNLSGGRPAGKREGTQFPRNLIGVGFLSFSPKAKN